MITTGKENVQFVLKSTTGGTKRSSTNDLSLKDFEMLKKFATKSHLGSSAIVKKVFSAG